MRLLVPLTVAGLLLGTVAVHPQPYDPYGPQGPEDLGPPLPPPAYELAPPPPEDGPPPRRMICVVDTPAHQRRCPTFSGYPGSPCRCAGSVYEGTRDFLN